MALFGKKDSCPICDKPVKGLLNAKIADKVILCQECTRKINMDSSLLPFQSIEDIKEHLRYREQNAVKFDNFKTSREITISNGMFIRVDDEKMQWYYGAKKISNPPIYDFSEIIDYELTEDGDTISKGGLGSAVAGGILFGGVGAVVGGITGGKKTKTVIKSMQIRLSLNNKYNNSITFDFIPAGVECKKDSIIYKGAKMLADNTVSLLDSMCSQAQKLTSSSPESNSISGADEILKYKNLLDCGIITQEEFESKKKQILGI